MGSKEFRYADKQEQIKKINRFLALSVVLFSIFSTGIVTGSYMNGYRSLSFLLVVAGIMVIGNIANLVVLKKVPHSIKLRWMALFEIMVLSLMMSIAYESDYMRFMPIIPFIGCILFYDVKFSGFAAIYLGAMNWIVIVIRAFVLNHFETEDVPDRLIACLVISIMLFIVWYATLIGKRFNNDSLNLLRVEAERQKEVSDNILHIAEKVRKDTEHSMSIVNELKESSEVVHHAVNDISESTNQTAENIQTQTVMTRNIQENIERTEERSEHMVKVAERSNEVNAKNMEMVQELKKQADVLSSTNEQVAQAMQLLRDNVSNVKNITNTIVSISSKTNLLALNASIESARAGEAGCGFAVVAEQIRELSENTRRETERISAILEELTKNADQTVEAVEKSVAVSSEQERMITDVADRFDEMNRNVNELVMDITDIDNMIESLASANNQIVDNIMQLSATTEEVTAAAQQSAEVTQHNFEDSVEAQKLLREILELSQQMDKYI